MSPTKAKTLGIIGFWAFIIGFAIAVIGGLIAPANAILIIILVLIGIIIGFLNVTSKEILLFIVATIALIVAGGVFEPIKVLGIGKILDDMLSYVTVMMAPAAVISAIKALWAAAKPGE
jgi:hypothetical protein